MTVSITEFITARLAEDEQQALAAPYSDHPDFEPEWSIT